ncbi:hypothetical protein [Rhodanobacter sp. L36]|uniref:hypothetical protein n=1 Tax=Rhodanobacter sp. L36 TaxID=1747221 RepID=UPI00131B53DD|nr:hypothetical protein [Rhodanobacter sp. L36]
MSSQQEQIAKTAVIGDALHGETDRGCAVLSGCVLEEVLRKALRHRLGIDEENLGRFVASGQIARGVDLAYFVGLISEQERRDWKTLVKIRNRFAHSPLTALQFDEHAIAALIDSIAESHQILSQTDPRETYRLKFVYGVGRLYGKILKAARDTEPLKRA